MLMARSLRRKRRYLHSQDFSYQELAQVTAPEGTDAIRGRIFFMLCADSNLSVTGCNGFVGDSNCFVKSCNNNIETG